MVVVCVWCSSSSIGGGGAGPLKRPARQARMQAGPGRKAGTYCGPPTRDRQEVGALRMIRNRSSPPLPENKHVSGDEKHAQDIAKSGIRAHTCVQAQHCGLHFAPLQTVYRSFNTKWCNGLDRTDLITDRRYHTMQEVCIGQKEKGQQVLY